MTATLSNSSQLVADHDRLACRRAHALHRKLPSNSLELADLLQIARMGLVDAARTWREDNAKGASFATYAYYRIEGTLIDHVRTVIGRNGQRMGVINARSLDQVMQGTDERTALETLDDYEASRQIEDVEGRDLIARAGFDEREAYIVAGILADVPLKSLAAQMGLSQSRVSQIVAKMREKMRASGLTAAA